MQLEKLDESKFHHLKKEQLNSIQGGEPTGKGQRTLQTRTKTVSTADGLAHYEQHLILYYNSDDIGVGTERFFESHEAWTDWIWTGTEG